MEKSFDSDSNNNNEDSQRRLIRAVILSLYEYAQTHIIGIETRHAENDPTRVYITLDNSNGIIFPLSQTKFEDAMSRGATSFLGTPPVSSDDDDDDDEEDSFEKRLNEKRARRHNLTPILRRSIRFSANPLADSKIRRTLQTLRYHLLNYIHDFGATGLGQLSTFQFDIGAMSSMSPWRGRNNFPTEFFEFYEEPVPAELEFCDNNNDDDDDDARATRPLKIEMKIGLTKYDYETRNNEPFSGDEGITFYISKEHSQSRQAVVSALNLFLLDYLTWVLNDDPTTPIDPRLDPPTTPVAPKDAFKRAKWTDKIDMYHC